MKNQQVNDNMTLVDFVFHQYLKNDICSRSASALLKGHYQNGWTVRDKEIADLIFSLLCGRTLNEIIEVSDCSHFS
ncbi:MAG: hypothetical protein Roseis2KO_07200 [Roseivirga sp.]